MAPSIYDANPEATYTGTKNSPLPPSVEAAYYSKCIALKRRVNEVEESNDAARVRKIRINRQVLKMRLERAFLLEQLQKRMDYNVDESDDSTEPPTTPQDRPLRSKRAHGRKNTPPPTGAVAQQTPSSTVPGGHPHDGSTEGYFDHANTPQSNSLRMATPGGYPQSTLPQLVPGPPAHAVIQPATSPASSAVYVNGQQYAPTSTQEESNGDRQQADPPYTYADGEAPNGSFTGPRSGNTAAPPVGFANGDNAENGMGEPSGSNDAPGEQSDAAGSFTAVNR